MQEDKTGSKQKRKRVGGTTQVRKDINVQILRLNGVYDKFREFLTQLSTEGLENQLEGFGAL